ncbi:hypothetical protein MmiAt1_02200 [Methanimicrococcus sp. At1]|uniref:Cytochrome B n=1 Tax=Methanimicrococcus hacksteinii TaxID=3028293 RepID=A0ABU3VP52_9EURY|nr:cytochrome B [Methanimicrococcus sp. At1]MDV0444685.1 hypothetical protein [Methanimicrococcus sp. At1]
MSANAQKTKTVERYNWLERWTHTFHAIAMLVLIFTGLAIYFGWGEIISFHNARILHMIMVPVLILTNWCLVPYGILSHGWQEGGVKGVINHFYYSYIFNKEDYYRLKGMVLNFFGKQEKYPEFTVYNKATGHYKTKLHPMFKIFIVVEGMCIFLIFITGIVLYKVDWNIVGIPIAHWLTIIFGWISPILNMNGLEFARWLHLALTYFFIFELICHAFILEFDTKVFKYWRSIFIDGKEYLDSPVVQVIDEEEHH